MWKGRFLLFHKELFPALLLSSLNSILFYSLKPHLPLTISLTGLFICYRHLLFLFPSSSFLLSLSFTLLFFPQLFLLFVCCLNPFTPSPSLLFLYITFFSRQSLYYISFFLFFILILFVSFSIFIWFFVSTFFSFSASLSNSFASSFLPTFAFFFPSSHSIFFFTHAHWYTIVSL